MHRRSQSLHSTSLVCNLWPPTCSDALCCSSVSPPIRFDGNLTRPGRGHRIWHFLHQIHVYSSSPPPTQPPLTKVTVVDLVVSLLVQCTFYRRQDLPVVLPVDVSFSRCVRPYPLIQPSHHTMQVALDLSTYSLHPLVLPSSSH